MTDETLMCAAFAEVCGEMCIRDRPLGVGAAIYLTEYATNRRLVAVIEFATETLTGIPSIIFGLVGMLFLSLIHI